MFERIKSLTIGSREVLYRCGVEGMVCMVLRHASVGTHTHTQVSSQCCYVLCEMTGLQQSPQDPHHCSKRTDMVTPHSCICYGREEVGGKREVLALFPDTLRF